MATTHLLHTMASELPDPPFDYQVFFASPQTQGYTAQHNESSQSETSSGDVAHLELPTLRLTPSMALPDMALGRGQ